MGHLGIEIHTRSDKINNYFSTCVVIPDNYNVFLQAKKYVSSDEVGNETEPRDGSLTNKHEWMSTGNVVITRKETIT